MIPASALRFLTEPPEPATDEVQAASPEASATAASAPDQSQVFVRTLSSPPGWPWEQRRSAELDARHGAPLPVSELLYRVRRLHMWRPGAPARYAAFYVLARNVGEQFEAQAEVDGREVSVTFGTATQQGERAVRLAAQALVLAAVGILTVGAVGGALSRRSQTAASLDLAEARVATKARALTVGDRWRSQDRLLERRTDRGARLRDVVGDIAWVAADRAPEARIEAVHWRAGVVGLEVRGAGAPVALPSDRRIERSSAPIRRNVWLWAIAQQAGDLGPREREGSKAP